MANISLLRTLPHWMGKLKMSPTREVNYGGLFVFLVCINGGIALLTFLLRTRIYDDQFSLIFLVAGAVSLGTMVWWYLRSPLKGQRRAAQEQDAHSHGEHHGRKKNHEKKHKRKKGSQH